jgi:putative membrane protein
MENSILLKKQVSATTIILAIALSAPSCMQQQEDTKETAEEINKETMDTRAENKDARFLVDVAEINIEEIQLGRLAQAKSTKKEVKDLGKMMEDEHTKSLNELKELASKKGISIPTAPTEEVKDEYEKLSNKKESEFNEEYCEKMVKGHKDAIDKVEKVATESNDNDIKAWAAETLPTLKKHLDHAMTCQGNIQNESRIGK